MVIVMNDNYKIIYIKKKNKLRKLITYNGELKRHEHEFIVNKIKTVFSPSIFSKGYVEKESIYTNVGAHMYNNYFFKTDIKDFFSSINHKKLIEELYKEIYMVASAKDCREIVERCSIYDKGLPLGFVSSPLLANIYLKRFDIKLYSKLKRLGCDNLIYTRYVDDIMISFKNTDESSKEIKKQIELILEKCLREYYLKVNYKKTKFIDFYRTGQVRLTGITIVEKNGKRRLSIGRENKRKLFYDAINYKKNNYNSKGEAQKIKGRLSFYLSIEKTNFEDFISDGMKKELEELGFSSLIDLIFSM